MRATPVAAPGAKRDRRERADESSPPPPHGGLRRDVIRSLCPRHAHPRRRSEERGPLSACPPLRGFLTERYLATQATTRAPDGAGTRDCCHEQTLSSPGAV